MIASLFSRTKMLNFSVFIINESVCNHVVCILNNNTCTNIKKSKVLFETRMNDTVLSGLHFIIKSTDDLNQRTQTGVTKMGALPLQ